MFSKIAVFTTALLCVLALSACSSGKDTRFSDESGPHGTPFLVAKPEDLQSGHSVSAVPSDPTVDYSFTWDLIASQNKLAGTVTVDLGNNDIKVTYTCASGWTMSQAQMYAGTIAPNAGGAPGLFPYKQSFSPPVTTFTFTVPLIALGATADCGQVIYIATHATVKKNSGGNETAWGGKWNNGNPTYEFGWGVKWGGYFSCVLLPSPLLPPGQVWYNAVHRGLQSYWGVHFENSATHPYPPGPWAVTPAGNQWVGWCADKFHYMYANYSYKVTLANSCSESLPLLAQNGNWDKINFLVTERNDGEGIYNQNWTLASNMDAFEEAVWWFTGGVPASSALALQMIADADSRGDNFVPHLDDHYVVILLPDFSTDDQKIRAQMNVIELRCD